MEDHNERSQQDQPTMPPPVPPQQEPQQQEPPVVDIPPLKPNNWLWQSIVATVLCCIPFGIAGIVYAAKVDSFYFNGQYEESERAAKKAKMWTSIAFAIGILYLILWIIMFSTGNMPAYMENIIEESASGYNF
ncbi:MAG: CD225/dispanin family protein [Proteiniphilum sp.]|nr:CD225/dispanin family protein [Proteiniphilum sp.]